MGFIHSYESFGTVDGPGIRFVVFFQGCPMRCLYCHNPDSWELSGGREVSAREVFAEARKYKNYFGAKGGITVSGGEPLMQLDFLIELLRLCKEDGINTCVDTSGICFTESDPRYEALLPYVDLFLLDIKVMDEGKHRELTKRSGEPPKAFLKFLNERGKRVWIRHVLVGGYTDDDKELEALRAFLEPFENVEKTEILPYHTMGEVKYEKLGIGYPLKGVEPPSKERVERAKEILKERRV